MTYKSQIETLMDSVYSKDNIPRLTKGLKNIINDILNRKINVKTLSVDFIEENYKIERKRAEVVLKEVRERSRIIKKDINLTKLQTTTTFKKEVEYKEIKTNEEVLFEKLCLIREKYHNEIKIHGEQTSIKEGFVYLVKNVAWNNWVKAGMTFDYENRLINYNLNDPTKGYKIIALKWVNDRRKIETILLDTLLENSTNSNGEWFSIDDNKACELFYNLDIT